MRNFGISRSPPEGSLSWPPSNYPAVRRDTPVPKDCRGLSFPPFEPNPNEKPNQSQEQNNRSNAVLLDVHSPSPQDMDFAAMILVGGFFVSVGAIFVMLWLAMGLIFGL